MSDDVNDWNTTIIEEFRANGGKVGGNFAGAPLLLLHTTGARSGAARINPMMYQDLGDGRVAVFASKAGADTNPAWVHNLRANPRAHIEVGTDAYDVVARELPADERDATYPKIVELAATFGDYQAKTNRVIPLFELQRA